MTGDQRPLDPTQKTIQSVDREFALQAAGLGVWEWDPMTNQIHWDERCRELFGLPKHSSLSYQQAIHSIHVEDADRVNQALHWALNPASNGEYDETFRTIGADDGQLRWVRFYGKCFFSEEGGVDRFGGVAQEVTQQEVTLQRETLARQQGQRQLRIYEAITASTPDLMYVFDRSYRFTYANQALLEMWGKSWEDSIGKSLLEIGYEPWHAQMHEREIDQVVATKQPIRGEVSFPHATLGRRIYDYVFAPVLNDQGEVEAVAGTTRDITDIRRAQELTQQSEARFRSLIEEAPVATAVYTGPELVIEIANERMIRFFGRGPSILGKPIRHILTAPGDQAAVALLEQVFTSGKAYDMQGAPAELTIDGLTGTYYFDLSLKPLRNSAGEVYAIIQMAVEVTEQVNARRSLQESEARYRNLSADLEQQVQARTAQWLTLVEDLRRTNNNLQQFAYIASHDLQEPLRKIQSFGDLLGSQYAGALGEGAGYLERIQTAAGRMSTLIKDLLAFSRISTQQDMIAPVSLNEVLGGVVSDLEIQIRETGAEVAIEPLPTVAGDGSQLGQLFQNLLSNALKFRRPTVAPQIRVSYQQLSAGALPPSVRPTRAAGAYYQITVADNGIGFNEKYVDRIFQIFQRLHGKGEYAGTGIGLAICQNVVANHGGAITAQSQPGQGSTFSVYLPA